MTKKAPKKTKKQLKIAHFDEHFLPLQVYFCANEEQWHDLLADKGISDRPYPDNRGARITTFDHHTELTVVILTISKQAEKNDAIVVMGMLVHELVHVKQFFEIAMYGENSGSLMTTRLDIETEAYLMQKLVMWIIAAYANSGRKFMP